MDDELLQRLKAGSDKESVPKPQFFDLSKEEDAKRLSSLLEENSNIELIDTYETQLKELFVLNNPALNMNPPELEEQFEEHKKEHYGDGDKAEAGNWVYLPWRQVLLHLLRDEDYQQVRTGRNRNLITKEEQVKYYNSTVGVAGQSVGNSCTLSIVQTGGGKNMRLADMDTLELTNLNRIRGSVAELTNYKVNMSAHQVYELDPYANLELFADGLTEDNIEAFFDGPPKLDVVVDEIDNLEMKIRLRQEAKKRGVPVVMATDNGDSGVIDVERYDLDKDIVPFHGRAGDDIAERVVGKKLPLPAIGQIIGGEILGYDTSEERTVKSLLEIGKSIPTWPQLGSAATLNGVFVSVIVRRILTGQPVMDDRAIVSVPGYLEPGYNEAGNVKDRLARVNELGKEFNRVVDNILGKE